MALGEQAESAKYQGAQSVPRESEKGETKPDSTLLSSQTARMREREGRFRHGKPHESNLPNGGEVDGTGGKFNPVSAEDNRDEHRDVFEGNSDASSGGRGRRGRRPMECSCEGGTNYDAPWTPTLEDSRKAKPTEHKEKDGLLISSEPDKHMPTKVGACAGVGKVLSVGESEKYTSKMMRDVVDARKTGVRRQAASDEAAKMARRAERFGTTCLSSVSEVSQGSARRTIRRPTTCTNSAQNVLGSQYTDETLGAAVKLRKLCRSSCCLLSSLTNFDVLCPGCVGIQRCAMTLKWQLSFYFTISKLYPRLSSPIPALNPSRHNQPRPS